MLHALGAHLCERIRRETRPFILVDDERPHAFDEIAIVDRAVDDAELHAKTIRKRHLTAAHQGVMRHFEHRRRMAFERGEHRARPVRFVRRQRPDDALHAARRADREMPPI